MRSRVVRRGSFAVGLECFLCLPGHLVWYRDFDGDELVALAAVATGYAFAAHPQHPAVRRACRQSQGHRRAVEGRYFDLRAECRLWERHWHGDREVVARATEQRVRSHVHEHDEVARRAASLARGTFTLQTNSLTVVDAGRDPHLHGVLAHRAAAAVTDRAR